MKKTLQIVSCFLLILCTSICFTACNSNNENEFVQVYKVSYVANSEIVEIYSQCVIDYDRDTLISVNDEEYYSSPSSHNIGIQETTTNLENSFILNLEKSSLPSIKSGDYIYFTFNGSVFFKAICSDIKCYYISVCIVSDNTIKIKLHNGEISTISTSYYNIEYFNY